MNKKILIALFIAVLTTVPLLGAPAIERPTPPYLLIPQAAIWEVKVVDQKKEPVKKPEAPEIERQKPEALVSMQCWLRDNDYRRIATFANGKTRTSITLGNYFIETTDPNTAFVGEAATMAANFSDEANFINGFSNPWVVLNWISSSNFVRVDFYNKKAVYVYQKTIQVKQLKNSEEAPEAAQWTVMIDVNTKFPVAISFNTRTYEISNLQVNVPISDSLFRIPDSAKRDLQAFEEREKRAHKLQEMLTRSRSNQPL